VCHIDKTITPFRPYLKFDYGMDMSHNHLLMLVSSCWHQDPNIRPEFVRISAEFKAINVGKLVSQLRKCWHVIVSV